MPVVVISSLADNRVIGAALMAGADGFIPKYSHRDVFRVAFEAIRAGRVWTPLGYFPISNGRDPVDIARLRLLTRQRARLLELICDGLPNKQIVHDLSIAETTVKAHVTAIMGKLGVQSRTQAVLVVRDASVNSIMPWRYPAACRRDDRLCCSDAAHEAFTPRGGPRDGRANPIGVCRSRCGCTASHTWFGRSGDRCCRFGPGRAGRCAGTSGYRDRSPDRAKPAGRAAVPLRSG